MLPCMTKPGFMEPANTEPESIVTRKLENQIIKAALRLSNLQGIKFEDAREQIEAFLKKQGVTSMELLSFVTLEDFSEAFDLPKAPMRAVFSSLTQPWKSLDPKPTVIAGGNVVDNVVAGGDIVFGDSYTNRRH